MMIFVAIVVLKIVLIDFVVIAVKIQEKIYQLLSSIVFSWHYIYFLYML